MHCSCGGSSDTVSVVKIKRLTAADRIIFFVVVFFTGCFRRSGPVPLVHVRVSSLTVLVLVLWSLRTLGGENWLLAIVQTQVQTGLPIPQGTSPCLHAVRNHLSHLRAHPPVLQVVPPSPINSHASNHSPSLTSAVLSSTKVHHSYLPAPSSALSSPFFQPSCHTYYLHLAVPSRYRPPLPSTFPCHPMYSLPPPSGALAASSRVSRPTRRRGVSEGCY